MNHKIKYVHAAGNWALKNWFFCLVMLIFGVETSRIALTTAYPMAFDEAYHFELIQFFSHHLNPFITSQPASASSLGAIVQNPSILYHYLLSFPYRLIAVFVHSLKGQVIALRFINIFFELCNLVILRLVFKRLRVSRTMSGIVILLFAFTPVFSQLSAQINYDNLLFPVTALAILQLIHFYDSLKKGDLRLGLLMSLAITCLLASLIQYEFLPIFFGIFLCVIWLLLRAYTLSFRKLKTAVVTAFWHLGRRTRTVLSALLVFSAAVFSRFYIVNIFRYGNPVPQCNQVLSIAQCKNYAPWYRNYEFSLHRGAVLSMNSFEYVRFWIHAMTYQLFSAVVSSNMIVTASADLIVAAKLAVLISGVCLLFRFRKVFRSSPALVFFVPITVIYVAFLFGLNYSQYHQLGTAVAVQGRYLLPLLPYTYLILALATRSALSRRHYMNKFLTPLLAFSVVLVFVSSGGYVAFMRGIDGGYEWNSLPGSQLIHSPQSTVANSSVFGYALTALTKL